MIDVIPYGSTNREFRDSLGLPYWAYASGMFPHEYRYTHVRTSSCALVSIRPALSRAQKYISKREFMQQDIHLS